MAAGAPPIRPLARRFCEGNFRLAAVRLLPALAVEPVGLGPLEERHALSGIKSTIEEGMPHRDFKGTSRTLRGSIAQVFVLKS